MHRKEDREEQLARLRARYALRGREGKGRLLDEFCEQFGYDRKYATKLLGQAGEACRPRGRPPGPQTRYDAVQEPLERIWRCSEQLCGKRLQPALKLWLPHYEKHFGRLVPRQRKLLEAISAATIDRLLSDFKARVPRRLCGTKPGTLLRTHIPLTGDEWDQRTPGYLEADTVAHCGTSLAGEFIWTLTYTDLASGWTEGRAVWNKGAAGVLEQTRDVEQGLPFPLLGFDCDNGSEFLNWHLVRYFQERQRPVRFTRSRPYHKDDNAHVEQKNWMWARQMLGYDRLSNPCAVPLINSLYKEAWAPLANFFLPSAKLVKKERVGSRWVREHDRPQTAYERLLQTSLLSAKQRRRLKDIFHSLDPFTLAKSIEKRLEKVLLTGRSLTE